MNETRRDGIYPNSVLSPLRRHAASEMSHPGLGNAIGNIVPGKYVANDHPVHGGDIDDSAALPALDHVLRHTLAEIEKAREIRINDAPPLLIAHVLQSDAFGGDRRIIHQNVNLVKA